MTTRRPIALTMGEPAGIGQEITLKAWERRQKNSTPPFYLIADPDWLKHLTERLGVSVPVAQIEAPMEALEVFEHALPVLPLTLPATPELGRPCVQTAQTVIASIERGVSACLSGDAAAVVTNPIQKSALYDAGFQYPGHTEYLGVLAQKAQGQPTPPKPMMMLSHEALRVVPVTSHVPLSVAISNLTTDLIAEAARQLDQALRQDFGFHRPRIVVAGLNPHAGEGGALGREEIEIIEPAIEKLQSEGLDVKGPLPSDTLFHLAARMDYDAVLAMYHDQALIPLKTIDFDTGVNSTHGLPFVRTSPDHGTALSLAGTGTASARSLEAALVLADFIAARRANSPLSRS
ncbi:MAG: 4-hydroxythreonine-4-phosphate dehydrogenase PdxA [Alphaproteobacteria bacterium]|nr:MAG: 4-hydroxythreonine-4-phosphate dehydrogenase PdxA [Alphaproteobacteria bacterium]